MVEPIAVVVEPIGWTPPLTIVANSHRAADEVVVEQIGRESQLKVLHGRAHQGIAVAYPNLSAIPGCPSPAARTAATGFISGPMRPATRRSARCRPCGRARAGGKPSE